MGCTVSALAVKSPKLNSICDSEFLSKVCNSEIITIDQYDWKKENYIGIRREADVVWLFSDSIVFNLIEKKDDSLLNRINGLIDTPELIFALNVDDHTGSICYSIFENGTKIREYIDNQLEVRDIGSPLEAEKVWNNTIKITLEEFGEQEEYYYFADNPETKYHSSEIPNRNLEYLVKSYFGYEHWDHCSTLNYPEQHYLVKAWEKPVEAVFHSPSIISRKLKSSWWKFWK